MPSGWVRWLLEQYEFPFEVVYPQTLDAGNLASKYDVLIFADGAIPERDDARRRRRWRRSSAAAGGRDIPAEYPRLARRRHGRARRCRSSRRSSRAAARSSRSAARPASRTFRAAGRRRARREDRERRSSARCRARSSTCPARCCAWRSTTPIRWPTACREPSTCSSTTARRLRWSGRYVKGVRPVAWFDSAAPLRSGWAWGQQYLEGAMAVAEAPVGKGRLFLLARRSPSAPSRTARSSSSSTASITCKAEPCEDGVRTVAHVAAVAGGRRDGATVRRSQPALARLGGSTPPRHSGRPGKPAT